MGIGSKFLGLFKAANNLPPRPGTSYAFFGPSAASISERTFQNYSLEGYGQNGTVFACVGERSGAVAALPWKLWKTSDAKEWEEVQSHWLLKALDASGGATAFQSDVGFMDLAGNSFWYANAPGDPAQPITGQVESFVFLRPDRVKVIPSERLGVVAGYEYKPDSSSKPIVYHPTRVLHRKTFNPSDDLIGISPLAAAWTAVAADNSAGKWNVSLLQNNGKLSGILVSNTTLTDQQFERIKSQLNQEWMGPKNAGKIAILEGERITWQSMSSTPAELDWIAGRKLSHLEICRVFKVPPELVGIAEGKTYSNYQEARKAFWTETIIPYALLLEADLNRFLQPVLGAGYWLGFDRENLEPLQEERSAVWTRGQAAYQAGAITANEFRKMVGLDPAIDELANVRMVPFGVVPATEAEDSTETGGTEDDSTEDSTDDSDADDSAKALSLKVWNVEGEEARSAAWKSIDRRFSAWISAARPKMRKLLNDDLAKAVAAVKASPSPEWAISAAENAIDQRAEAWEKSLKTLWMTVGMDSARQTARGMKSGGPVELKVTNEQMPGFWQRALETYTKETLAEKIVGISDVTKKAIRGSLREAFDSGLSIFDAAKELERTKIETYVRAERIAQTEIIGAANFGSITGARGFGVPLDKVWLATRDDRTRESHSEADGQRVDLGEPFSVNGESLDFPGDQDGSAGNVINCRCSLLYKPKA